MLDVLQLDRIRFGESSTDNWHHYQEPGETALPIASSTPRGTCIAFVHFTSNGPEFTKRHSNLSTRDTRDVVRLTNLNGSPDGVDRDYDSSEWPAESDRHRLKGISWRHNVTFMWYRPGKEFARLVDEWILKRVGPLKGQRLCIYSIWPGSSGSKVVLVV